MADKDDPRCVILDEDRWEDLLNVLAASAKREQEADHDDVAAEIKEIGRDVFRQVRD